MNLCIQICPTGEKMVKKYLPDNTKKGQKFMKFMTTRVLVILQLDGSSALSCKLIHIVFLLHILYCVIFMYFFVYCICSLQNTTVLAQKVDFFICLNSCRYIKKYCLFKHLQTVKRVNFSWITFDSFYPWIEFFSAPLSIMS